MARAPVSKTGGWGFESLHSCHPGKTRAMLAMAVFLALGSTAAMAQSSAASGTGSGTGTGAGSGTTSAATTSSRSIVTDVVCNELMLATFCNVTSRPNNAGYGAAGVGGTGPNSPSLPPCSFTTPPNELCD